MSYFLKKGQPPFEVVDGPMAGQKFEPGVEYEKIPEREKKRFTRVRKAKGDKK